MASGVATMSCSSGQQNAGIEPAAYYTVDWPVVLGGTSAAETVLDPARMVPFHVVRQQLVFPMREQDSLDAMIGGGRDAQLLPDGRVLILGAKGYLLLLDSTGVPRLLARPGEGPGELAGPEWMKVLADGRIAVWDGQLLRLSWYRADSGFQGAQRVELSAPDGRRVFPLAVTEDGGVIARIHGGYPTRDGVHINQADIRWINVQGEPAERLLVDAPFSERHLQNLVGPGGRGRSIAMFTPPFARTGDFLAGSRRLCFVWTGAADVACTRAAENGWTLLRDTSRGRHITDRDMDALLDSNYLKGVAPGRTAAQEDAVRGMPRADSMPRWGRGYVDVDDALWMPRMLPFRNLCSMCGA